jgi:hypothetical protein
MNPAKFSPHKIAVKSRDFINKPSRSGECSILRIEKFPRHAPAGDDRRANARRSRRAAKCAPLMRAAETSPRFAPLPMLFSVAQMQNGKQRGLYRRGLTPQHTRSERSVCCAASIVSPARPQSPRLLLQAAPVCRLDSSSGQLHLCVARAGFRRTRAEFPRPPAAAKSFAALQRFLYIRCRVEVETP